jgi:hypothetical protein
VASYKAADKKEKRSHVVENDPIPRFLQGRNEGTVHVMGDVSRREEEAVIAILHLGVVSGKVNAFTVLLVKVVVVEKRKNSIIVVAIGALIMVFIWLVGSIFLEMRRHEMIH